MRGWAGRVGVRERTVEGKRKKKSLKICKRIVQISDRDLHDLVFREFGSIFMRETEQVLTFRIDFPLPYFHARKLLLSLSAFSQMQTSKYCKQTRAHTYRSDEFRRRAARNERGGHDDVALARLRFKETHLGVGERTTRLAGVAVGGWVCERGGLECECVCEVCG